MHASGLPEHRPLRPAACLQGSSEGNARTIRERALRWVASAWRNDEVWERARHVSTRFLWLQTIPGHVWPGRRDNDIHIFHVLPLAAEVSFFIKTDPGWAQKTSVRSSTSRSASGNRKTPCQAPAPQRTVVAHSVDNSASNTCRVSLLGSPQLRACNSHASSLSRSSNGAFLSGKNNNSNSRITRAFRLRHQSCSLAVRISLQRPTFETIPSARIPVPVLSEPLRGSYPSLAGYLSNWLRHVRVQLNIPPQFCACYFTVHF